MQRRDYPKTELDRREIARLDKRMPPERAAYHEAGHVVIAAYFGIRFRNVTIKPQIMDDYIRRGHVSWFDSQERWPDYSKASADRATDRFILVCMAGLEAERIHTGRKIRSGADNDYKTDSRHAVGRLAAYLPDNTSIKIYGEWLRLSARQLLSAPEIWRMVEAVASDLLKRETLTYKEVRNIITHSRIAENEKRKRTPGPEKRKT